MDRHVRVLSFLALPRARQTMLGGGFFARKKKGDLGAEIPAKPLPWTTPRFRADVPSLIIFEGI